jgi:hypothetical protein
VERAQRRLRAFRGLSASIPRMALAKAPAPRYGLRHAQPARASSVQKDGQVLKQDGVMMPPSFFHVGPVNGWGIR